jgi:hypothetical protein
METTAPHLTTGTDIMSIATDPPSTASPSDLVVTGLDAVTRCCTAPHWYWHQMARAELVNAHRGVALAATAALVTERLVDQDAAAPLLALAARCVERSIFLFVPREPEEPSPQELQRLLVALGSALRAPDHLGHETIAMAWALRAFHERPALVTRARVAGLYTMIEAFHDEGVPPPRAEPAGPPGPEISPAWLLEQLLAIDRALGAAGLGCCRHLLGYGQAVLMLRALGHAQLSAAAESGLRAFIVECLAGQGGPWGSGSDAWRRVPYSATPQNPDPVRVRERAHREREARGLVVEGELDHPLRGARPDWNPRIASGWRDLRPGSVEVDGGQTITCAHAFLSLARAAAAESGLVERARACYARIGGEPC